MQSYQVKIKLSNNTEVQARVEARNQSDAIRRLEKSPEFVQFLGDAQILSVDIQPIELPPVDNKRFALTTIDNKQGWYIAVDLDNRIKIQFKAHKYNETNSVVKFGEKKQQPIEEATAIRELSDWLLQNFPDLI